MLKVIVCGNADRNLLPFDGKKRKKERGKGVLKATSE